MTNDQALRQLFAGPRTDPLDIVLASPGLPHDGNTLAQRSLGGSETAAIQIAAALRRRGHHVTVFSPCPGPMTSAEGVAYRPLEQFAAYATTTPHDVTVISRALDFGRYWFHSPVHILWCHDLALKRARDTLGGLLWNFDAVYVLSSFMRAQYREVHPGIPDAAFFVTRNGIDLAAIDAAIAGHGGLGLDRHKLVYGSRPERGLENALEVMALLGRRGSPLRLEVSGYDNTPPQMEAYYAHLRARAEQMPNVVWRGPLAQGDWYRQLATAAALLYPGVQSEFREISCLVACEAQAVGTPIVGCARGALPETVHPNAGVLLGDETADVHGAAYRAAFADAVVALTGDPARWQKASDAGRDFARTRGWAPVAEEWEAHWRTLLDCRRDDGWRIARELVRRGDLAELAAVDAAVRGMAE